MMRTFNIHPIIVLDGRDLPSKHQTNNDRSHKRTENLAKAHEFKDRGDNELALKHFKISNEVIHEMENWLIFQLRKMNVDYLVLSRLLAPY